MHGEEPSTAVGKDSADEASSPTETKRRAARRRFLAKGTATGSGVLIVTLFHERAFATQGRKVNVSSPEQCASLGGHLTGKQKDNSVSNTGPKRDECEIP